MLGLQGLLVRLVRLGLLVPLGRLGLLVPLGYCKDRLFNISHPIGRLQLQMKCSGYWAVFGGKMKRFKIMPNSIQ
ncbi:unnamed protein product [Pleuronectes platessa]|uniref:Uncharacterized protein n=1 Tax=Pleuronectes platessa TaxID=8262 RepID=A0A9N7V2Q8_PLEPL|nr:unnamed protein product [Pleuronectes platessa]